MSLVIHLGSFMFDVMLEEGTKLVIMLRIWIKSKNLFITLQEEIKML